MAIYGQPAAGANNTKQAARTIAPGMVPFVQDIANQAQGLSRLPYQPPPDTLERIAPFSKAQTDAQTNIAGMQNPQAFGDAYNTYKQNAQFTPGMFGAAEAAQYMNPYTQNVTNIGIRELQRIAAEERAKAGLQSAQGGAYGGSGNAIMDAMLARTLNQDVATLSTKGQYDAYNDAQKQFNDYQSQLEQAANVRNTSAQGLASLGSTQQAADLERYGAQNAAGTDVQNLQQRKDDMNYADFKEQRDYPTKRLTDYANIFNSLNPALGEYVTERNTTPTDTLSQVGGLGLAGIGEYLKYLKLTKGE